MKTIETTNAATAVSQPGNLSVRQLAKALTTATATGKTPENGNSENGAAATREVPPSNTEKPEEEHPKTGNEEISPESTEGTEAEQPAAESAAEETTAEETSETNGEETAENAETTEEQPATISDAVSQRLDAELKPLIDELTQAGAKGALQILQKRIPKLVDQRDTERNGRLAAEEQVSQLRRELQDTREKGSRAEGRGSNEFVHPEVAKVTTELSNVDHWLTWCEEHPEGGEVPDGKGGTVELDAKQTTALRRDMERERQEVVARKVQTERDVKAGYDRLYQQHHATAVAQYPWLKNANSPEHHEMQAILKAFPQFKASPDYELAIGDFMSGKALRLAKAKAANGAPVRKPAPPREPTKVTAEPPSSSAQRKSPEKAKKDEADSQFKKSGRMTDLAKSFAASRRASRAA